uniref:Uncharacterized protein n=1 Tax=Octopus bimaculoides TaxID=37653 RepID=A0A0L8I0L7_OCTBM
MPSVMMGNIYEMFILVKCIENDNKMNPKYRKLYLFLNRYLCLLLHYEFVSYIMNLFPIFL